MKSFSRIPFDTATYIERIQIGNCFICEIVAGKSNNNHIVYQDAQAIVFLNKYPTLYGYTLVAPREHREQVTGDFSLIEYLALQRLIHRVAEAVRVETQAERVYVLSLGSQQGNRHVHWHIAPLPPGVPFEQQQLEALRLRNGILDIPAEEMTAFADRLRARMQTLHQPLIRPIVIGVFRHVGKILVFEAYDSVKRETYHRPLGGGIEPGEFSQDALAREIREELGAEITRLKFLGTLENIFTVNGKPGHEIVLVYDGAFVDTTLYERTEFTVVEPGETIKAYWKSLDYFRQPNAAPLYPTGLLELLENS